MEEFRSLCEYSSDIRKRSLITSRGDLPGPKKAMVNAEIKQPIDFFWKYFPVPIDKAPTKLLWLNNRSLARFNNGHKNVKDDIESFERQIAHYSLSHLYQLLEENKPLFSMVAHK